MGQACHGRCLGIRDIADVNFASTMPYGYKFARVAILLYDSQCGVHIFIAAALDADVKTFDIDNATSMERFVQLANNIRNQHAQASRFFSAS